MGPLVFPPDWYVTSRTRIWVTPGIIDGNVLVSPRCTRSCCCASTREASAATATELSPTNRERRVNWAMFLPPQLSRQYDFQEERLTSGSTRVSLVRPE